MEKEDIERGGGIAREKYYIRLGYLITKVQYKELQEKTNTYPVDVDSKVLELQSCKMTTIKGMMTMHPYFCRMA